MSAPATWIPSISRSGVRSSVSIPWINGLTMSYEKVPLSSGLRTAMKQFAQLQRRSPERNRPVSLRSRWLIWLSHHCRD